MINRSSVSAPETIMCTPSVLLLLSQSRQMRNKFMQKSGKYQAYYLTSQDFDKKTKQPNEQGTYMLLTLIS